MELCIRTILRDLCRFETSREATERVLFVAKVWDATVQAQRNVRIGDRIADVECENQRFDAESCKRDHALDHFRRDDSLERQLATCCCANQEADLPGEAPAPPHQFSPLE